MHIYIRKASWPNTKNKKRICRLILYLLPSYVTNSKWITFRSVKRNCIISHSTFDDLWAKYWCWITRPQYTGLVIMTLCTDKYWQKNYRLYHLKGITTTQMQHSLYSFHAQFKQLPKMLSHMGGVEGRADSCYFVLVPDMFMDESL